MGSGIKQVYGAGLSTVYTATEVTNDKEYIKSWVGQERFDEQGNKYRFVKNVGNAISAIGEALCYDVSDATFTGIGKVVTNPATADLHAFAGVAKGLIPANGYGYIQTAGYNGAILLDAATTVTAGQAAYAINGATGVDPVTASGTAPLYQAFVKIAKSGTTLTSVQGWIYGTI